MKKKLGAYDPSNIEKKWQKKWAGSGIYEATESDDRKKYYVLDMFPYPSGEGLHVGHPKGYIATDVISRMKRMQGMNVLHPMGFDAFGLPAENYAIKTKTHPEIAVRKNVDRYKKQLELLGFDYDWSREVNTTDPKYYKWTQWIFLQLWKKGLAFESNEPINWCPSCKTGLANEDIENGRCERCGTPVEKKPLRQWVLKITDYADRLLNDLDAEVLSNSDLFVTNEKGEPGLVHMNTDVPGRIRHDRPFEPRQAICAFVEHWSDGSFIVLKWKKVDWTTPITGGIEKGQTPEQAARAEIYEETGFKNLTLIKQGEGEYHSTFFHPPKDINRIGHFRGFHFKLNGPERDDVVADEQAKHDVAWLPKDQVREAMTAEGSKLAWDLLMHGKPLHVRKPLLDWPESIKELQRNWIGRSEGAEIDFRLTLTKNKPRFVILHGWEGSADTNFLPWLKKELEKLGHEVQTPQLPNSNDPTEEEQVGYVLKNCTIDENTVVIGHSLGSVVALKAIMKLNRPISGLVLIASAIEPGQINYKEYPFHKKFTFDYDYERVKKLTAGKIAVLSDLTEKYRVDYLRYLAKKLDASLIETKAEEEHFTALKEPAILECCTPEVKVFTTRPDTIFGVTYLVMAPEHMWVQEFIPRLENRQEVETYINRARNETEQERTDATKEKTGVELKGIKAINPANGEEVPVWIADYVLADYGTGAVMAVPAHDERDFEFAKKFGLPIKHTIVPEFQRRIDGSSFVDGVAVVIFNKNTQRYACLNWTDHNKYTLVTGGRNDGESYELAAKRELEEEAGITEVGEWVKLGEKIYSNYFNSTKNAWKSASSMQYLAIVNSEATHKEKREVHETFEVEWHTASELLELFERTIPQSRHIFEILGRAVRVLNERKLDTTSDASKFSYVTSVPFLDYGRLVNAGEFEGARSEDVIKKIVEAVRGKWVAKYKLRDWVFSRQRYWGEPIPLIHCEKCGVVPVPEKDLPVELPKVESYEPTGTGESPLAAIEKWVNVKCPQCRGRARRETNTMPQWAGSCWYYLRYEDPRNKKALVDPRKEKYWSPIDLYVGGAEHATRHLIYARFWHKFLFDIGAVSTIEPFSKLQSVGLIMGEDGRKMSKRFGNVVNPDEIVATYGADTMRLYEMFMGPFDQQIAWNTSSMVGARRFIERIWKLADRVISEGSTPMDVQKTLHKTIRKVTDDIESLRFNTAVSSLMICANELEKAEALDRGTFEAYLKLLAPFAPHVAEELWMSLGNRKSIHISAWPSYDPAMTREDTVLIMLQINGKVRGSFTSASNTDKAALEAAARALPEAQKWLEGREIKKVVVVPGRLVNFVV